MKTWVRSMGVWIVAAICLCGSRVVSKAHSEFTAWMNTFEQAKRKRDFPACEDALTQALKYGLSEYAVGSLVWAQMNEGKTEVALQNAQRMRNQFGNTPYAVGSLIDASMRDGDFDTMVKAAETAKRLDLVNGTDWTNRMVKDLLDRVERLTTPAMYHLKWTIPGREFTQEHPTRKFGFPLLKTPRQTFKYTLEGAVASRVIEAGKKHTVVEITGTPGQNIVVTGEATIRADAVGARTLRRLAKLPLSAAPQSETGVFYYWKEAFDPTTPCIAEIVKDVHRQSAVETIQAILDWRDKEMPYRKLLPGPGSTLERIVAQRCGVCHDASYMTASLARANGIPAVVIGVDSLPESGSFVDADTSHGHISVNLPEIGWTRVEPLRRESLLTFGGSNYLQFTIEADKEEPDRISLQSYLVSGQRIQ